MVVIPRSFLPERIDKGEGLEDGQRQAAERRAEFLSRIERERRLVVAVQRPKRPEQKPFCLISQVNYIYSCIV